MLLDREIKACLMQALSFMEQSGEQANDTKEFEYMETKIKESLFWLGELVQHPSKHQVPREIFHPRLDRDTQMKIYKSKIEPKKFPPRT